MARPWNWVERRAIVLDRGDHECVKCGGPATEADHIWPRSHGGSDEFHNLQAMCRTCNAAKGNSLLFTAMTRQNLLDASNFCLNEATLAAGNAARWISIAWAVIQGEEPMDAHDAVGDDIAGTPEDRRRWVLDAIAERLGLPQLHETHHREHSHVRQLIEEATRSAKIRTVA